MVKKINSRPPIPSLACLILLFGLSSCLDEKLKNKEPNEQLDRIVKWAKDLPEDAFILESYSKAFTLTDENKSEVFDIISQELYDIKLQKPDSIYNDFKSIDIKKIRRPTYRDTFLLDLNGTYDRYKLKDANVYKLQWTYKNQNYSSYAIVDQNQQIYDPILGFLNRPIRDSLERDPMLFYGKCESYKLDDTPIYQTGDVLVMDSYGPDRGYIQLITNVYYDTYITNKDTPDEKLDIEVKIIETKICSDFQGNCFGEAEFESFKKDALAILNKKRWDTFHLNYSATIAMGRKPELGDSSAANKANIHRVKSRNSHLILYNEAIRRHALKFEN
ncbi:hypothetical protein [Leeuwenhoekiella sp. H156]|uniref:hypothetical protein n=1 Tax=Leeuwenhoekiella sp. H156 TaxID=3450128 RepID=UPI003FA41E93